jgi:photosystem II stability/assembly factor-like uncharacterized protein
MNIQNFTKSFWLKTAKMLPLALSVCLWASPVEAQQVDMDKFKGMKPRHVGTAGMSGRVTSIAVVRENPETMYIGSASGGLWKTTNAGIDWQPVFDEQKVASIGAVAISPQNPMVVWAGTGEGNPRNSQSVGYGIYKSMDGGKTWKCMGLEKSYQIHRIIVHPQNPDVVYVAAIGSAWHAHPDRGVFKTTDGGKTWQKILYANDLTGAADMVIDPQNPNKLFVAMWEYQRQPWTFNSGGKGSGLYVTYDGGATWTKQSTKNGLPEGDLGRIGLAIAQNKPNVVYAWIESKKNALYRSDDGGEKWTMINDKADIGDRPFYYAEIYVDPKNENRVYTIYSRVGLSEDGGKSFKELLTYDNIHPDHHAWYIHPDNPNFIVDGNDGGMALTYNGGKSWRFIDNLPLGQFYHINYDLETPYNIYGGMQDNGSWRMPAYLWREGGIRNHHAEVLLFGDGFDVVPDAKDSRYGYAMWQGGNLNRYDLKTGATKNIRPVHPEGKPLRFNWNAGVALDPIDQQTLYYGSQYVHKSTNKGDSWEIISPDLTTNNPAKQKQDSSGGLTLDVTNAENHTTILCISPSPVKQGVLWVGTDDGNVQVSKDGGATWTNVIKNIKGVPEGSWIPQIVASTYNEGEAFVVINNYRRGDWTPYIFQTKDFGQTWKRLVDEKKVWGFALSFVQDVVEPKLLFAGTEFGLYVSFDGGDNWNKWKNAYPTVPTIDLKIHPKEHDLIIGTFGRAAYVLDDIRPLRKIAQQNAVLQKDLAAFESPEAYIVNFASPQGVLFAGKDMFQGDNRPEGAMLTYYAKVGKDKNKPANDGEKDKEKDKEKGGKDDLVKVEILNTEGKVIRTLYHEPDSGMNRLQWDLREKATRFPNSPKPKPNTSDRGGFLAAPATYKVRFSYKGAKDSTMLTLKPEPRLTPNPAVIQQNITNYNRWTKSVESTTAAVDRLKEMKETIELVSKQLGEDTAEKKKVAEKAKALKENIQTLLEKITGKEKVQGLVRNANLLSSRLGQIQSYFDYYEKPTAMVETLLPSVEKEVQDFVNQVNTLTTTQFTEFRKEVEALKFSVFKDYETLK